jgi:hypothetical protein
VEEESNRTLHADEEEDTIPIQLVAEEVVEKKRRQLDDRTCTMLLSQLLMRNMSVYNKISIINT